MPRGAEERWKKRGCGGRGIAREEWGKKMKNDVSKTSIQSQDVN